MKPLERHHHFRWELIPAYDRLARLEARVVSLLMRTDVPDESRDSSIAWELKHQAGVAQCARILAAKRGLDIELAAAGALLHDIYVIVTGSYEDHARRGGPIASDLLDETGSYTPEEKAVVDRIVVNHSDKHLMSPDPYIEFGKDADVLDCLLYPDALDEYLLTKPFPKVKYYLARAKSIWAELGIPVPVSFTVLDDYVPKAWLKPMGSVSSATAYHLITGALANEHMRPFALQKEDGRYYVYAREASYADASDSLSGDTGDALPWLDKLPTGRVVIVWPGLAKYEILNEEEAIQHDIFLSGVREEKAELA